MNRPTFNTSGLESVPAAILARMVQKATQSWCYVTTDGRSFYVTQIQAERMQALHGGEVFPPAITTDCPPCKAFSQRVPA